MTDIYIIGRLLFSIGYTIGTLIGYQSFRAIGHGLTFGPIVVILGEIVGKSIVGYLQWFLCLFICLIKNIRY